MTFWHDWLKLILVTHLLFWKLRPRLKRALSSNLVRYYHDALGNIAKHDLTQTILIVNLKAYESSTIGGKGGFMVNNNIKLTIKEVEARLSTVISKMSEKEKRDLLERLEKWEESKDQEARKHYRRETSIYAVFSGQDCYFRDYIKDISAGGLFIETGTALFINQELIITFFLPDASKPVKIKGKVVRTDSKGVGIKFDELLPDV